MLKLFILLAITIVMLLPAAPGFCGAVKTTVFQISVTIPPHIITNSNLIASSISKNNNPYQLVQTQTVIRNNKLITLTSIVVP